MQENTRNLILYLPIFGFYKNTLFISKLKNHTRKFPRFFFTLCIVREPHFSSCLFSFDEGICWNEYKFTNGEDKITITGLIAEPGEKATDVAIWGWDDEADGWVRIVLEFSVKT